MKKAIMVGLISLGLILITAFAFATNTSKCETATANSTTTTTTCPQRHNGKPCIDANNDGICNSCGMQMQKKCGNCTGNCCGKHEAKRDK